MAVVIVVLAFALAVTSAGHVVLAASDHFLLKYSGVFALLALTGSVCMGVVAADRIVMTPGHRVLAQAVHRAVSFGALAFLVIHIVLEITAPHLEESQTQHVHILDAFIPFLSQYRTFYMAEGTIASDIIVLLVITGIIRRRFTAGGHAWKWRVIHYSSYAALILGVLHGLLAGRKAIGSFVYWSYGIVIVLVALAVLVRILATSLSSREVVKGASPHADPSRGGGDSMSTRAAALGLMGQLTGTMPLAGANRAVAGTGLGGPGPVGLGSAGLGAAGALTAPLAGAPWPPAEPPFARAIEATPSAPPAQPGPGGAGGRRAAGGPGADGRPPRYEPGYDGPPRYEGALAPQPGPGTGPQPVYDSGAQPGYRADPYDTGAQPAYRADPYDRRGTGPQPAIAPGPRRPDPSGRPPTGGPGTGPLPRMGTGPIPRVGTGPIPRVGPGPAPQPGTGPLPQAGTGPFARPGTGPIPRVGPGPQPGGPGTGPIPRVGTGPQPMPPSQAGGFAPRPPAPSGPPPGYPAGPGHYGQDPYPREPYRPDGYGPPGGYPGDGGYRDDRDYGPGQEPYASASYESAPPYDTEHPYAAVPYGGYPTAQGYGAPPPPPGSGYPGPPQPGPPQPRPPQPGPPRPGRRRRPDHPANYDSTGPLPRVPSYGGDERR